MDLALKKARKKLGYLNDQEGIMHRYINEEGAWGTHLLNTKNFILECIEKQPCTKIAILGSGWLLDVPLDYFIRKNKRIYLFDIYHPKQVQFKVKNLKNVFLIERDLTGGMVKQAFLNRKKIIHEGSIWLNKLKCVDDFSFNEFDFVISLNILNQVDIIICDYLISQLGIKEKELVRFRTILQDFHLSCLPTNKSCLISDVEEWQTDEVGTIKIKKDLIYTDMGKLNIKKTWIWDFDNQFTYNPDCKTKFKVIAAIK